MAKKVTKKANNPNELDGKEFFAAIAQIEYGYNARIVAGVFNLFYYASRIIDEDSEDMYPHPAFADVDMRAKKEDRAKRMGLTMGGM